MRRVIQIGVLLVLTALVVRLGMALAQKPADTVPRATAPAAVAPAAAPVTKAVSPAGPAAPAAKPVDPYFQPAGVRVFATPPGVPAQSNVVQPLAVPSLPDTGGPSNARAASGAGGGVPMMGGITSGPAGMMSGPAPTDPMVSVPMPGMATARVPVYGVPISPELQKLTEEVRKAQQDEQSRIAQYAAATNEQERNKLKESLSKVLDRQFDLQQQMRKLELDPIEARVKRLRELIDKRNQARKTIVEKRLDQLLRDAEGMGWTPPGEPAAAVAPPIPMGASTYPVPGMYGASGTGTRPRVVYEASKDSGTYTARIANVPSPAKSAVPVVEGFVLTDPASGQIEIPLGTDMGISKGHSLDVYRVDPRGGISILGRVEVVETKPDRAVCKIVLELQKGAIKKGDRVTTRQVLPPSDATKQTEVKIFNLLNADASSYAEIVSVLPAVNEKRVQISVDKRTNSLVASGPKEDLLVIEALLLRLDTQKTPKTKVEDSKATKR